MSLSTFLNGRPATRLRGLQWISFSDTAVIQIPVITPDGGGGGTTTWLNSGTVPCRVYPVTTRGRTGLVGGQVNERSTHFLEFPLGTDIDPIDRVEIVGRGTFEVTLALLTTDGPADRVEIVQVT